jgi:hypothetical protein
MLWEVFLEFKIIILEVKLSNKFRNDQENFSGVDYPSKKSQNHGNSYAWKIFMIIFEYIRQFFSQNDVFKLQAHFPELGIRVFLENVLGTFQTFLILQIWDKLEVLKIFQKEFWKLNSKQMKPPILWISENTLFSLSKDTQLRHFFVFLEDSFRIISGVWRERFGFRALKLNKNRWFFYKTKTCSLFVA